MGLIDVIALSLKTQPVTARKSYIKWKDQDCFKIGDYVLENCSAAAIRKFKQEFPGLKERTVQTCNQKVEKKLTLAVEEKRKVKKSIPKYSIPTACHPLMLGELDKMMQVYLKAVSSRCAVINI